MSVQAIRFEVPVSRVPVLNPVCLIDLQTLTAFPCSQPVVRPVRRGRAQSGR